MAKTFELARDRLTQIANSLEDSTLVQIRELLNRLGRETETVEKAAGVAAKQAVYSAVSELNDALRAVDRAADGIKQVVRSLDAKAGDR